MGRRLHGWVELPANIAWLVGLLAFACGVLSALHHAALLAEPDLVANGLYFQQLRDGRQSLASLAYFPAPKILPVLLLGPLTGGPGVVIAAAAAAALVSASIAYLVARSFGGVVGLAAGAMITLDPRWTVLLAIGSADLLVAAFVTCAVACWTAGRTRLAIAAAFLAVLTKPTAAPAILPLLLDRDAARVHRVGLVAAAALALVLTALGYRQLLGAADVPNRFLDAYRAVSGIAPEPLAWLARYLGQTATISLLPLTWPLALIGLWATLGNPAAGALRKLLGAALAVASAHAALALWTDTLLYERFLWLVELASVTLATVGAFRVARLVGGLVGGMKVRTATATFLLLLLALDLVAAGRERRRAYLEPFGDAARKAAPLLDRLAVERRPDDIVNVPLWLQPQALHRLDLTDTPRLVQAASVVAAFEPSGSSDHRPRWVVFAPGLYEAPGRDWIRRALASGSYVAVAQSGEPPFTLLRGAD